MNWRAFRDEIEEEPCGGRFREPDPEDTGRLTLCEALLKAVDFLGENGGDSAVIRILEKKAEELQEASRARERCKERVKVDRRCLCRGTKGKTALFCVACETAIPVSLWFQFFRGTGKEARQAMREMRRIAKDRQDTMAPVKLGRGSRRLERIAA